MWGSVGEEAGASQSMLLLEAHSLVGEMEEGAACAAVVQHTCLLLQPEQPGRPRRCWGGCKGAGQEQVVLGRGRRRCGHVGGCPSPWSYSCFGGRVLEGGLGHWQPALLHVVLPTRLPFKLPCWLLFSLWQDFLVGKTSDGGG